MDIDFKFPTDFDKFIDENNFIDLITDYSKNKEQLVLTMMLFYTHVIRIRKNIDLIKHIYEIAHENIIPLIDLSKNDSHRSMLEIINTTCELSFRIETGVTDDFTEHIQTYISEFDNKITENFMSLENFHWAFFYNESLAYYFGRSRQYKKYEHRVNLLNMIANLSKNLTLQGLSYYYSGDYYVQIGKYNQALENQEKAKDIFSDGSYDYYIKQIDSSLAIIYQNCGYFEKAIEYYKSIEKFYEKNNNELGLIAVNINLGALKEDLREYGEGIKYFKKALEIQLKYEHSPNLGIIYFNLISCSFRNKDKVCSTMYLEQLRRFCDCNNYDYISRLLEIAEIYDKLIDSNVIQKVKAIARLKEIAFSRESYSGRMKIDSLMLYCKEFLDYYSQIEDLSGESYDLLIEELKNILTEFEWVTNNNPFPIYTVQKLYLETYYHFANLKMDEAHKSMDLAENELKNIKSFSDFIIIPKPDFEDPNLIEREIAVERKVFSLQFSDSINSMIHALPRLNIMKYLYHENEATFAELKNSLNMTPGNLGRHCELLVEAGFVDKIKTFQDGKVITKFSISPQGASEFQRYVGALKNQLN